jgi:DNA-binding transcriptional ArsR family regulator
LEKAQVAVKKTHAKKSGAPKGLVDQRLLKALGHPLRTRILSVLNEKRSSPKALGEELSAPVHQTSYHVKVLREMGFIELVDRQQRRGAVEHFYRGVHRALIPADAWAQLPANIQQNIAADTFRMIITDANDALEANAYSTRPDSHVSHTPMVLDQVGWEAFVQLLADTLDGAFEIQAEAAARLAQGKSESETISVTMALAGFQSTRQEAAKPAVAKR